MASTKLADTFKAWRVALKVQAENLKGVINRCRELGLQPKVTGYFDDDGINVIMIIPFRDKEIERSDSSIDILREALNGLDVRFDGKPIQVELICQPKAIMRSGVCQHCGTIFPLVNFESRPDGLKKDKLVLTVHECVAWCCNGNGHNGICPGSGLSPKE